jgi:hypothetical protein
LNHRPPSWIVFILHQKCGMVFECYIAKNMYKELQAGAWSKHRLDEMNRKRQKMA